MSHTDFIDDLIAWIDGNLEGRLDLDTVAKRAGYSKWYLQRMFKSNTGISLGEYIRNARLKDAAARLATSQAPIMDVAMSLGFDSQQSFNRSFKRQFGESPGAWRRHVGSSYPTARCA
ncbi:AraC family transcriptional regulator [Enterobacterales bacterium CwR94]|nr:AraC family transcriptional regulator [Enterobacterales bacterium CwR94]